MMMFLAWFQRCAYRVRPGTNRVYFPIRKSRVFVHQAVGNRGHSFFPDFFTNQAQMLGSLLWIFLRLPILKVDMTSARVDVIHDEPGYRCKVAIPGPHGSVGMTITARSVQTLQYIWGHLHMRLQRSRGEDGGIGSLGLYELGNQKESQQYCCENLHPSHVHQTKFAFLAWSRDQDHPRRNSIPNKNIRSVLVYPFLSDSPIRSVSV